MMLAYNIWTWTAIATLAFGSITVFVIFLVTTLRQLRREQNPDAKPCPKEKTPSS
jgi:hypothetical protein